MRGAVLLFLLTGASIAHASSISGTIDSVHKYAWSNVGGYVNFGTAYGGVSITDSGLSGYAWSANDGWINLAPANGGVKNNGKGTLSGFAWDETAGWVNFSGVTIDSFGLFHGQATGGQVNGASYAINFDCTNCSVVTSWRRPTSSLSGGGCSLGFVWNPVTISCVPVAGGLYSPIIITTVTPPPHGASSTVTTITTMTKVSSPSPAASGVSGTKTSRVITAISGVPQPAISPATTSNTVLHATTSARATAPIPQTGTTSTIPGIVLIAGILLLILIAFFVFRFFW